MNKKNHKERIEHKGKEFAVNCNYTATSANEITVSKGDTVFLHERHADWYLVEHNNRIGFVPAFNLDPKKFSRPVSQQAITPMIRALQKTLRFTKIESKEDSPSIIATPTKEEYTPSHLRSISAVPTPTKTSGSIKRGQLGLLEWCKKRTQSYSINIDNFTGSWRDGKAICALIHSLTPSSFEYIKLKFNTPKDIENNVKFVLDLAQEQLNVPKLIDEGDFGLERLSMMTYLSDVYRRCDGGKGSWN